MDSRILASGPDIVVVNRSGKVYKCNTYHGGKAMYVMATASIAMPNHLFELGSWLEHTKATMTTTFGNSVSPNGMMDVSLRPVKLSSILT